MPHSLATLPYLLAHGICRTSTAVRAVAYRTRFQLGGGV